MPSEPGAEPGAAPAAPATRAAPAAPAARRHSGVEGNSRITAGSAVLLLVLLAAEGVTIPFLGSLLDAHILIGLILIPPLLVKMGSTGYRFVRYYRGDPHYRQKGPPPAVLRLLGPFVVVLSVVVVGSGVALLFAPARWRGDLALLHKASFVLWFGATTVHVLGHIVETAQVAPRDWYGKARRDVAGASWRQWLLVLSLVLGALAAAGLASRASSYHRVRDSGATRSSSTVSSAPTTTTIAPTTTIHAPTTTLAPTTTTFPASFGVGIRTITITDPYRQTLDYSTSPPSELAADRVITTEVRYPITGGQAGDSEAPSAPPASADGPFPVIVFAHGYAAMPDTYRPLLDSWVRAGFVVVAPEFPESNYYEWQRQGEGSALELDIVNQPYDIAYVVKRLAQLALDRRSFLDGLADMSRLGLAGQSDGATTVAGLAWGSGYRVAYNAMPDHPLAVAVLSGSAFSFPYTSAPSGSPAILSSESNDDYCNPTEHATALYNDIAPLAGDHWFLTFEGASHLGPYAGVSPWAEVASSVTTAFFELELRPRGRTVSAATLESTGDVSGVAEISSTTSAALPETSASGICGSPTPEPLGDG